MFSVEGFFFKYWLTLNDVIGQRRYQRYSRGLDSKQPIIEQSSYLKLHLINLFLLKPDEKPVGSGFVLPNKDVTKELHLSKYLFFFAES